MPINISGYDTFLYTNVYFPGDNKDEKMADIVIAGEKYTLKKYITKDEGDISLVGDQ